MAGESQREALSLLAAANNHGDLNAKLSSLNKLKDVVSYMEPASAAEVFPYLAELQSSPEPVLRKLLVEVIEVIGLKAMEHSAILMPVLLSLLRDGDTDVTIQSIASGTKFYLIVLEKMTVQFHQCGKVERWVEEMWIWMVRFKDIVFDIALQPGSVGTKILAFKFLETFILIFTPDNKEYKKTDAPGAARSREAFNVSWLVSSHPVIDPGSLMSEANKNLGILLNLLRSSGSLPGPLTISIVNCLAAIARKRPQYYDTVISTLFDFDPNSQTAKGCHTASIQYSLRTAFLGFLRCTYSPILESRDQLLRSLRGMNAGDAADQVIRQVDKKIKNGERALRETRVVKDDQQSSQLPVSGDYVRKRSVPIDSELVSNGHEPVSKRVRAGPDPNLSNNSGKDSMSINGVPPNTPLLDGELTAVEQMIAMIGALLAEGERGAESLEILISKIHPDLLADIVITNMRHLPKAPPPLTRLGNSPVPQQSGLLTCQGQVSVGPVPTCSIQSSVINSEASAISSSSQMPESGNILASDPKRDPRRDPRRLDPRRVTVTAGVPSVEESGAMQAEFDNSILSKRISYPVVNAKENPPSDFSSKIISEANISESTPLSTDMSTPKDELVEGPGEVEMILESNSSAEQIFSSTDVLDEDQKLSDTTGISAVDMLSNMEPDESYPDVLCASASEDTCTELPVLPSYIELSREHEIIVKTSAVKHIIESFKAGTDSQQMCMSLLARLISRVKINDEDIFINMLQKHVLDDRRHKGHELALHILYHLHSLVIMGSDENSSSADVLYEKFLLAMANYFLDSFPASDKSFSKLLGEVPVLPESALKLLSDLCYLDVTDHQGKTVRDVERVTQGLGAVWSLILGRPQNRQNCLAIALKCASHPQDEIRAKAIRLVANKLYLLSFISEDIEQCAINMLLSAVDHQVSETGPSHSGSTEQRTEGEVENQQVSVSGSQVSESATSENDSLKVTNVNNQQIQPSMSFSKAQRLVSLYFALCTKKPSLLQIVFNTYGSAPRAVKQAFHRHIPIVMRAIGQPYSELLHIISDPPQGSENLLSLVLQILTQDTTPSSELIATVKQLYETKLKDVSILVPMLSSLSKNEVLPIFPRLVELPSEKFQMALAHILQGSAHTGPALTPVEVLVAIHSMSPEKDGLPLKKIMDACSACLEQRTVFTQQVLEKALNQMVDQTPLPLLFMRTVIQAIDAFPALVDFLMEILSKLVSKQVWRMPKLWVGFLKCVSQTQPRSFHVLLQLPSPQLESALNKHVNLRGSLATYANQPSVKSSLPSSTLAVLGLK